MADARQATSQALAEHAPRVSILVPSYNHARYIGKALDSALAQDFADFELLISDDASRDNSWEAICSFADPRIRRFRQPRNLGPVGNLVFLIGQARGEYVALLNSDDAWYPAKLGKQVQVLNADPQLAACFTWAALVDAEGRPVAGPEAVWKDVFRQPNRSQAEWLRHFFTSGNCLCHPSMLMRRELYQTLGFYNPGLKQLPDFEMWVRLLKRHPIHIIQQDLVAHLRDGNNTSAVSAENTARNLTELVEIFAGFFSGMPDELFVEAFASRFRRADLAGRPGHLLCEQLFLLFDCSFAQAPARAAALSAFMRHLADPQVEQLLRDEYGFSVFDYYRLTGTSGFGHLLLASSTAAAPAGAPVLAGDARSRAFAQHLLRRARGLARRFVRLF